MAETGPPEDKAEKKDPFEEPKRDLFKPTGELKGGYDLGMARAYALDHAKKTQGEYVGRGKGRRLLVWEMDSSRFDEDAECWEVVLSCAPEKAQVDQKGVWVYHVRAMGGLMPGTPIQKQSLVYMLPEPPRGGINWVAVTALGTVVLAIIGLGAWLYPRDGPQPVTPTPMVILAAATSTAQPSAISAGAQTPTLTPQPTTKPELTPVPGPTATPTRVAAGATQMPTATPRPTITPPPLTGRIAFTSNRDGNREIYVMNADGTNLRRLTNHPSEDYWAVWSADGRRIAFLSERDGSNGDIYVMDADGTNLRRLTNDPSEDYWPAWSPDCMYIAFVSNRDGNGEIYLMDADGTNLRRLTNRPADDYRPVWSPDSRYIAFTSNLSNTRDIYVMNGDGTDQRLLTRGESQAWSPDGKSIVYENQLTVTVMNADGTNQRPLTTRAYDALNPVWSPDGRHIAFANQRDNQLYVMNADGTNVRRLTSQPTFVRLHVWSPDSVYIAFGSGLYDGGDIIVASADATGWRNLTNHLAHDESPAWGP